MTGEPFIPNYITVHLGTPDSNAPNVTLPFSEYIKNVASSEIYPTWPEAAIRANVLAQISFALNRYYTEFYRSRGYDFDITNSTRFDQAFVQGREYFDSISTVVDDIFNDYIYRQGSIEPLFARYCNGTTSTCDGLSQWGTVPLAQEGLGAYDILTRFYGDDINLRTNTPIRNGQPSYPGRALRIGDAGNDVQLKQIQLNRISRNYPAIPKIYPVDGVFGQETADAVRAFQRIFKLTEDGIVGNATWNKITMIYNGVKRLSELDSEGIALSDLPQRFSRALSTGDTGDEVRIIRYYLAVVGEFIENVPVITVGADFDEATRDAVIAFQKYAGLTPDGIVGRDTWNALQKAYLGIERTLGPLEGGILIYPGTVLRLGSQGDDVLAIQQYLNYISGTFTDIPPVPETGVFGNQTRDAVIAFQSRVGLEPNGNVGVLTWDAIAGTYSDLTAGSYKQPGQYPGTPLKEGDGV